MTEPVEWLNATQGLDRLQAEEFEAIRDFTLLWGLFEGKAMATDSSQQPSVSKIEK